jgi:acyl carrier protein
VRLRPDPGDEERFDFAIYLRMGIKIFLLFRIRAERGEKIMIVFDRVQKIVAKKLGLDKSKITQDTFLGDLGADQQTLNDIKHALEEEFGVAVKDDEASEFTDVDSICKCIESKIR